MALGRVEAKVVSRGSGHSAVAKAAYNARETLTAERYDKREDYSRKAGDCLFRGFYAPKDAPEWAQSRERFWNAVEWREKRKDAQLGREFEIALPHELTAEQSRWLLQDFVRENFTRKGYVADVAIHKPSRDGDERNIHAHVFVPLRRLEGEHWAEKKDRPSELDRKRELKELRQSWEKLANRHLARHGFEARIDMRSYAEQGVDRTPGVHMGKEATGRERRGEGSELGDRNRAAANENSRRAREPTPEQIEEARDRAATVRQQRAYAKAQAEERTNTMWDQPDGSTLSNMRERDRQAGPSRSTEHEARRAMDDLARTDPHGTARHFGHRAGDQLKTPEDMRREMAERMRGFVPDPQPEPARDHAAADPGRERTRPTPAAENQVKPRDPAEERAAWAARLRGMAQDSPQRPTRAPEREPDRDSRAEGRERVRERPDERPGASHLRAALSAARDRLDGLGSRLDATLTTIRAQLRDREAQATQQARQKAETRHEPREAEREPERPRGSATRERPRDPSEGRAARQDTSSRKENRDFANELIEEARRKAAQEAEAERSKARDHYRTERERDEREYRRVQELIRQDKRARRPSRRPRGPR